MKTSSLFFHHKLSKDMSEIRATYKGVLSIINNRPVASGTIKQRNEFFAAKISFNREEISSLQELANNMSGHGLPPLHIDMLRVASTPFLMSDQDYNIVNENIYMILGGLKGCEQKFNPLYEVNTAMQGVTLGNKVFTPVGFHLTRNGQIILTVTKYERKFHVMWNQKSEALSQVIENPIDFSTRLLAGGLLVRETKDEVGERRMEYAQQLIKMSCLNVFDYEAPKTRIFTLPS